MKFLFSHWLVLCLIISETRAFAETKAQDATILWKGELITEFGRYPGISFLGNEKVLVYETQSTGQLSARGNPERSSEFKLHASVLNAQSGAVEVTRDWNTGLYHTEVLATAGGVLVKTGGIVKLYTPDFKEARELPIAPDSKGDFFVSVSASGQTIAIIGDQKRAKNYVYSSHVDVLDATKMQLRRSWEEYPPIFRISMSDNSFVTSRGGTIVVTKFGESGGHPLINPSTKRCGVSAPTILSNDSVISRDCKGVLQLDPSGESYSLDRFDSEGGPGSRESECMPYKSTLIPANAYPASSGSRYVAVALPDIRFKKQLLAETRGCLGGLQVAIYDLDLKKRISSIDVNPLPQKNFDFALSPDGLNLTILNDRVVSVYAVRTSPQK